MPNKVMGFIGHIHLNEDISWKKLPPTARGLLFPRRWRWLHRHNNLANVICNLRLFALDPLKDVLANLLFKA
jgi:hypothetical protein